MENDHKNVFVIRDSSTGQYLQYLTPDGVPCWSGSWAFLFQSKKEAKKVAERFSYCSVIKLKHKEASSNDIFH